MPDRLRRRSPNEPIRIRMQSELELLSSWLRNALDMVRPWVQEALAQVTALPGKIGQWVKLRPELVLACVAILVAVYLGLAPKKLADEERRDRRATQAANAAAATAEHATRSGTYSQSVADVSPTASAVLLASATKATAAATFTLTRAVSGESMPSPPSASGASTPATTAPLASATPPPTLAVALSDATASPVPTASPVAATEMPSLSIPTVGLGCLSAQAFLEACLGAQAQLMARPDDHELLKSMRDVCGEPPEATLDKLANDARALWKPDTRRIDEILAVTDVEWSIVDGPHCTEIEDGLYEVRTREKWTYTATVLCPNGTIAEACQNIDVCNTPYYRIAASPRGYTLLDYILGETSGPGHTGWQCCTASEKGD